MSGWTKTPPTAEDRALATTLIESWLADTRQPDARVIDEYEARLAEAIAAIRREERERAARTFLRMTGMPPGGVDAEIARARDGKHGHSKIAAAILRGGDQ
jgi:hypothetical protein